MSWNEWLPVIFVALMGVAMLMYAVLDGYDLGVGILLRKANDQEKDWMIASIGPFWDANETWLVLGVGLLLVAFPLANGIILGALYLPVAAMLLGLILRGVAFDFRAKAHTDHKRKWDTVFHGGSVLAAFSQGLMLGQFIIGFDYTAKGIAFSVLTGVCLIAGYALIGAGWLIMRTEKELQKKAVRWARRALFGTTTGIMVVSATTPLMNPAVFAKWFTLQNLLGLAPIPVITAGLIVFMELLLRRMPFPQDRWNWVPFASTIAIYVLCLNGLAYSFFPYIVPGKITIWQAASAPESLEFILVGALIVLPLIVAYTFFTYRVFRGKVRELTYH